MAKTTLDWIALVLVIVGGLNWGLVGLFSWDLVDYIFVQLIGVGLLATIVYVLVALSAVYMIYKEATA